MSLHFKTIVHSSEASSLPPHCTGVIRNFNMTMCILTSESSFLDALLRNFWKLIDQNNFTTREDFCFYSQAAVDVIWRRSQLLYTLSNGNNSTCTVLVTNAKNFCNSYSLENILIRLLNHWSFHYMSSSARITRNFLVDISELKNVKIDLMRWKYWSNC